MNNFIKIKNLTKKYEKNKSIKVLDDISFNFESGKLTLLWGHQDQENQLYSIYYH